MVEDYDCYNKYGETYRDFDEAQKACDEEAKCFGVNDYKCDGVDKNGSTKQSGNYFKKCFNRKNTNKRKSPRYGTCVYVKGMLICHAT